MLTGAVVEERQGAEEHGEDVVIVFAAAAGHGCVLSRVRVGGRRYGVRFAPAVPVV